jgi:glycosyltransferase involved in cell wall biosynthesis
MTHRTAIEIVTFTTLYPNSAQPNHGVFIENRLRHLVGSRQVNSRVVAPVPWFPFSSIISRRYARHRSVTREELRAAIHVLHPRYLVLPKIGMSLAPRSLFRASLPILESLRKARDFDLIDAHYFYPDGVAAVRLGRALGKPVVITARGTDINLIPRFPGPRRMILEAAGAAAGIVAVSHALKTALVGLGVPEDRVTVLRNGVDLELFKPRPRSAAGRTRILLSVGHLIERKGHELVIGALPYLPEFSLLIVGEGPEHSRLRRLAADLKLLDRVCFLGEVPHRELPELYASADALILASSREGWPNVLLEAMACGTPVVASDIWGNPEVVAQAEAGVLMKSHTAESVAEAVQRLFRNLPDRAATRRYAENFGWNQTSEGQIALFRRILSHPSAQAGAN